MSIQLYNTLSGQKEPLETLEPNVVRMYVCGPTVYDNAHVGHARSVLVFDIIRRYLEYRGHAVQYVMNYTDVDDKIIGRAQREGVEPMTIATRYIEQFEQHLAALNVKPATEYPRVSTLIPEIVAFIEDLIDKGYAYPLNGSVYFRVSRYEEYGKLSNRSLEEARSGTRAIYDEDKEDEADFALWKAAKPGEIQWDSPWGPGRPGWHIECSVMSLECLGEQIDIHGGGNDLIFPHHENEIAQTEARTGKSFARYWVHNGMLQAEGGEKMSKSLDNYFAITDFLQTYSGDVLRMIVLNSHYRSPLIYNETVIQQAKSGLDRIHAALKPAQPDASGASTSANETLANQVLSTRQQFVQAMDDDFNTAGALGFLFDLVRQINIARDAGATDAELEDAQQTLRELCGVLGLQLAAQPGGDTAAEPFINLLVTVRQELREAKQWTLADKIRDELAALGVTVEDTGNKSTWHWS